MPKNNNRNRSRSNEYGGVRELARERPIATAAAAAAAVGAGVFLWSRRNQISNQLSELSDQISEWGQSFSSGDDTGGFLERGEAETAFQSGKPGASARSSTPSGRSNIGRGRTSRRMSETGGGNASLGARSGGGTTGSATGRSRANQEPTT